MFHLAELLSVSLAEGINADRSGEWAAMQKAECHIKLSTSSQINTLHKDDSHHWNTMQPDTKCQGFSQMRRSQTSHLMMSQQGSDRKELLDKVDVSVEIKGFLSKVGIPSRQGISHCT